MEVTQTRVTEENGCHPALPRLTWDRDATFLRLGIVGNVQVGGNLGIKKGKKWFLRHLGHLPRSVLSGAARGGHLSHPGTARCSRRVHRLLRVGM